MPSADNAHASDIRLTGLWGKMPKNWHGAISLMRLDRPIGWWLLLLPGWWSLLIATNEASQAIWLMVLFLFGAIVMRAAGCIINDLWDRDIDKKVARTALRPLASGEISQAKAVIILFCLSAIGLGVLVQLPMMAWLMGLASLPLIATYPLFKRFTYWPQAMLGLTFSWGIFLGFVAATGHWPDLAIIILYAGTVFWVIGFDTIYAIQDMKDDAIMGVKSSALALSGKIAFAIKRIYALALLLMTTGLYLHFTHWGIWTMGPILMGLHLYRQTSLIDETDPKMALLLFKSNRDAGLFMTAALGAELLL